MAVIDELLAANERFAPGSGEALPAPPSRKLAVLTCMDARIDPAAAFGLAPGDAHVLRNAGGLPSDDMLRSLAISQRALGSRAIAVIHHTACGMQGFDDMAFRAELTAESGAAPTWQVSGFADVAEDTRRTVEVIRDCPWLVATNDVRGFVLDVATGRLSEV